MRDVYFDLNAPLAQGEEEARSQYRARVSELGWQCIALSTDYAASERKGVESDLEVFSSSGSEGIELVDPSKVVQVSRVNVKWPQIEKNEAILAKCRKQYDLVACEPTSEDSFRKVCSSVDCDIISLDLTQRIPFRLNPKQMLAAVERGAVFEISYAKLLLDNCTMRRNVFSNSRSICRALRGKGIIISSGTSKALDLRSPADIVNMATFFDLKLSDGKDAICKMCRRLVEKAAKRRFYQRGFCLKEVRADSDNEDEQHRSKRAKQKL